MYVNKKIVYYCFSKRVNFYTLNHSQNFKTKTLKMIKKPLCFKTYTYIYTHKVYLLKTLQISYRILGYAPSQ